MDVAVEAPTAEKRKLLNVVGGVLQHFFFCCLIMEDRLAMVMYLVII